MRVHLASDLHLDAHGGRGYLERPPAADLALIPGDLGDGDWLLRHDGYETALAPLAAAGIACLGVAGNHEFHGLQFPQGLDELRAAAAAVDLRLLHRQQVSFGNWRILGAILWVDFELNNAPAAARLAVRRSFQDFDRIAVAARTMEPADQAAEFTSDRDWLNQALADGDPARTIVMTHYGCTAESLPATERDSALAAAFTSDLRGLIEQQQPALWVHGHIHHACDYRVGHTRVVCNPRGGPNEPSRFDPGLVIELPE